MNNYNGQFLYDMPVPEAKKPTLKQRLAKRTTLLSGTAAITLGALVGGSVGGAVAIGAFN
jgi:putative serine protease PepD